MDTFFATNWKEMTALGALLVIVASVMTYYLKQTVEQQKIITDINSKIFNLFTNKIESMSEDIKINKQLNKDTTVLQAKMFEKLKEHDTYNRKFREKELTLFERLCDFLNGGNPAIKNMQQQIDKMREEFINIKEKECN